MRSQNVPRKIQVRHQGRLYRGEGRADVVWAVRSSSSEDLRENAGKHPLWGSWVDLDHVWSLSPGLWVCLSPGSPQGPRSFGFHLRADTIQLVHITSLGYLTLLASSCLHNCSGSTSREVFAHRVPGPSFDGNISPQSNVFNGAQPRGQSLVISIILFCTDRSAIFESNVSVTQSREGKSNNLELGLSC